MKFCGLKVIVESSDKRVFTDAEFKKANIEVKKDMKECPVIFGIKEIPVEKIEDEKTYVFFSHVIKGQPHNMPMLKKLIEKKCSLIDYEKIADEAGRRLVFFGKYAGMAGMINSLWAFGQRLRSTKHDTLNAVTDNPFLKLKQSHKYTSLVEAKKDISEIGHYIAKEGLPDELVPMVIGFTGAGNVATGAQELCGLLPVMETLLEELLTFKRITLFLIN